MHKKAFGGAMSLSFRPQPSFHSGEYVPRAVFHEWFRPGFLISLPSTISHALAVLSISPPSAQPNSPTFSPGAALSPLGPNPGTGSLSPL